MSIITKLNTQHRQYHTPLYSQFSPTLISGRDLSYLVTEHMTRNSKCPMYTLAAQRGSQKVKKGVVTHLRATMCHLPYQITSPPPQHR